MTTEEILDQINAAIVTYTLDRGEAWDKAKHVVRISEDQFIQLCQDFEWEHTAKERRVHKIDLPHAVVQNGGPGSTIRIEEIHSGTDWSQMQSILKTQYLDVIKQYLGSSTTLPKQLEKK